MRGINRPFYVLPRKFLAMNPCLLSSLIVTMLEDIIKKLGQTALTQILPFYCGCHIYLILAYVHNSRIAENEYAHYFVAGRIMKRNVSLHR